MEQNLIDAEGKELFYVMEETEDKRFPYRLSIRDKDENSLLVLYVQDRWPGEKGNIFCIREENPPEKKLKEIERVPVKKLTQYGKRIVLILDRKLKKRCDFIILRKKYKNKEGEYEQIFWRTQKGIQERKMRVRFSTKKEKELEIIVDPRERYAWKFNGKVIKKALPVGDYALMVNGEIVAVIERKTFNDMLHNFSNLPLMHQRLLELETYKYSALVIEATYSDFLNPKKVLYFSPSFCAKALAEISTLHPNLQVVFAGGRKMAREWSLRFFLAVKGILEETQPTLPQ